MSGETKFTPGPWSEGIERFATVFSAFGANDEDGHIVCDCYGPDARANAHLIAASPELYAALEAAQIMMVAAYMDAEKAGDTEFMQRLKANNEAAKAALAKARGESQ